MFSTLLIANRGEIARRVMRTARRMGMKTVAVYSDADAAAAHMREADEAFRLGPAPAAESYLRADAILEAAAKAGADAIHPGYGFLSENADFAEAVAAAGVTFIGPDPASIRAMGLKDEAKALMSAAGVPVTPGYHGDDQTEKTLKAAAKEVGYPVLIKAVAGGGGKGMRKVEKAGEFSTALTSAKREAAASFGDDRVLIEKFITGPRHIEVQVFGDRHGGYVHFYERDCSLQRRHQKVIEEAPAPGMTAEVRDAMTSAAIEAARAVDYVNAGTVEFIVDGSKGLRPGGFWFMEMNTRLQVEHPVTEMVTGIDLVALQLKVAAGEKLPAQKDIPLEGHAVEARVYAEDPANGFLPSIGGMVEYALRRPDGGGERGRGVREARQSLPRPTGGGRIDEAAGRGDEVTPYYDPMIAKVMAWAEDRDTALDRLAEALEASVIAGPATNVGFLARCLRDEDFAAARLDTGLLDRRGEALTAPALSTAEGAALAAVALEIALAEVRADESIAVIDLEDAGPGPWRDALERQLAAGASPWDHADGWRLNAAARISQSLEHRGERFDIAVFDEPDGRQALVNGAPVPVSVDADRSGFAYDVATIAAKIDGRDVQVEARFLAGRVYLSHAGDVWAFAAPDHEAAAEALEAGDDVKAPMPGKVIAVETRTGAAVARGQTLIVLEAMKMEHALAAPRDGEVGEVRVAPGDQVKEGDALVRLVEDA